mmetsp:Transcript_16991/g.28224  ORF Transcript_16991/g.28224 Transcript_16991/m.28224 type:complete len:227 (-) Transcript_16991:117-797(-)
MAAATALTTYCVEAGSTSPLMSRAHLWFLCPLPFNSLSPASFSAAARAACIESAPSTKACRATFSLLESSLCIQAKETHAAKADANNSRPSRRFSKTITKLPRRRSSRPGSIGTERGAPRTSQSGLHSTITCIAERHSRRHTRSSSSSHVIGASIQWASCEVEFLYSGWLGPSRLTTGAVAVDAAEDVTKETADMDAVAVEPFSVRDVPWKLLPRKLSLSWPSASC